ncbi:MAG: beta-lactamase family protein [Saprospiraceae bacterium]|nr:beta-lactamase family protein [Saprospiraceae bacterium]
MRTGLITLIAAIVLIMAFRDKEVSPGKSSFSQYADSLFQTNVDSAFIAGASILVYQHGDKLLDKSYGFASLELSAPIPENASFEIGSVTKQFTAAAILKLADAGKLNLDDDFTKYLKFDTKGKKVTINNLLNHTSGIASYTELNEFWDLSIESHKRDSLVRLVEKKDFLFEPGEALIYNNSGYFFLGLIIEEVSGKSYEDFLQENIFDPLGMNHTYYCSTQKVVKGKVYGYNYAPDGLKQKPYLDHTWPYAAGSLCSPTEDLLIWMKALHQGKIMKNELYHSLITPGTLADGTRVRYAKGLTNSTNFGHQMIAHGGGIHGFLSETRYFPNEDLYIICLVNTTGPKGAGYFAEEITWKLLDKIPYQKEKIDIDLQAIAGKYQGQGRGRMLSIEVASLDNGLTILFEGAQTPDTLDTYIGHSTWMKNNDIITFQPDRCLTDFISGFYSLEKMK